jgi:hypothetical protein
MPVSIVKAKSATPAQAAQSTAENPSQAGTRTYDVSYIDACGGDIISALVFAQIGYWFTPNPATGKTLLRKKAKDGQLCLKKSVSDWKAELRLTRRQVERANKILVAHDLVQIELDQWGKSKAYHYRLTVTGLSLVQSVHVKDSSHAQTVQMESPSHVQNVQVKSVSHVQSVHITENTKDTKKTQTYKQANTEKPFAETPVPEDLIQGTEESKPQPPAPLKSKKAKKLKLGGSGDWTVYGMLEKTHDMSALLDVCIRSGFVETGRKLLTETECSMLDRVEHTLLANDPTDSLEKVLPELGGGSGEAYEGANWGRFCDAAEAAAGKCLNPPPRPKWDFLVKHLKTILNTPAEPQDAPATPTPEPQAYGNDPEPAQAATEPRYIEDCPGESNWMSAEQVAAWVAENPPPPPPPAKKLTCHT